MVTPTRSRLDPELTIVSNATSPSLGNSIPGWEVRDATVKVVGSYRSREETVHGGHWVGKTFEWGEVWDRGGAKECDYRSNDTLDVKCRTLRQEDTPFATMTRVTWLLLVFSVTPLG